MTDKITQPADTADGKAENNATTSADGARDDGGKLLRQLGELRRELECMRGELGAARAAGPGEARRDAAAVAGRSAGSLTGAADSLFSPAEVRAMSRAEVRANLDRIRESMRHWN